jgi:hypothetical protein
MGEDSLLFWVAPVLMRRGKGAGKRCGEKAQRKSTGKSETVGE